MRGSRAGLACCLLTVCAAVLCGADLPAIEDARSTEEHTTAASAERFPGAPDASDRPSPSPPNLRSVPIYSNSGDLADPYLITRPGAGCAGRDVSDLQTVLGLNGLGFSCLAASSVAVADDFSVPAGETWRIDQVVLYLYQTDIAAPSITDVFLHLQAANPLGETIPILTSYVPNATWTDVYKNKDTDPPASECSRRIQQCVITLAVPYVASVGTHYVIWQGNGSGSSGPWVPPVVVPGATNKPGANGMLASDLSGGLFAAIIDSGASHAPQDLVFVLCGTIADTTLPGDMNCDGVISYADINPFVLALSGQAAYEAQYPECRWLNADVYNDGEVTYADINAFVRLLSGSALPHPGDMNCDGVLDYGDINPFVLALASETAYEAQYPNCRYLNADVNADGDVTYADINAFVALLSGA